MKPNYFIANWKMRMPLHESVSWCEKNAVDLKTLNTTTGHVIICPSHIALSDVARIITPLGISAGAQDCSEHENGSYTGQVDAQSIKQSGANYCIIGHSERRKYCGEETEKLGKKLIQLIAQDITPILCIGENKEHNRAGNTTDILQSQLSPLLPLITNLEHCLIAYEPIWAIGSGEVPSYNQLNDTFLWLNNHLNNRAPNGNFALLYGGSVNEDNAREIMNVQYVDGLLIGGASLDFQKFQKIVSLGIGE